MRSLKDQFILRTKISTTIQSGTNGFIGLGIANILFKDVAHGLIIFQIFMSLTTAISFVWTWWTTKEPTNALRIQLWGVHHYTKLRTLLVIVSVIGNLLIIYMGKDYWLPISIITLPFMGIAFVLQLIEGTTRTLILNSEHIETNRYYERLFSLYTLASSSIGQGMILLLPLLGFSQFSFELCIGVQAFLKLVDTLEYNRYILLKKDEMPAYIESSMAKVLKVTT